MLSPGGSSRSSDGGSESIGVSETPPSLESKEEKPTVPTEVDGKSHGIIIIEESKPRASVLEYKTVNQMCVQHLLTT